MLVSFKGLVVSRGFREQQCSATGRPVVRNASTEAALHKLGNFNHQILSSLLCCTLS